METFKTYLALKNGPNFSCAYSWNAPVFLFANENIRPYLTNLTDITGKKVLTVAASGDHAFEALLAGAAHVDTFDINYLQKHVMELKSKTIKHLPYGDFIKFFFGRTHFFDRKIIEPIWKTFSPELRTFLNMHYKRKDNRIFRYNGAQHSEYSAEISYVTDELAYNELKNIMPAKISFKEANITEIATKFETEYDMVMLSNIFEYMYPDIQDMPARIQKLHSELLAPIADNILSKDDGKICFHYTWNTKVDQWTAALDYAHKTMFRSIDDFADTEHTFGTVPVPSVCNKAPLGVDLMLYMNQRTK